ncbi:hypothetical protein GLOIN_2v1774476 [Rhizophagus irregularis DAOM 181602=DAOM 197198]|uniref:Uncharacterized protein n=2 Tax=Rhizophagus irregularis (strain DAOM 181602 / DAOM 197198 / MUCL 43194) TaxID=747089 RepID=A0A2P4Q281_RHIID|nr:hypothetical protein GLOIN_2v1774476 [Rhizophagus irregularis DAOM 181602=DAOM 197198]POG71769.1 hypothetical protein GLOIN_2v1774476 [Rhizophagus irregularis DAOM 181602=DAOM 197198]|eukprot:XP_025178635.1 hypothetical protein GLOIN_2v1774476 [Rhizophagus irregularis DAOM 181602=DAOM 197198]
MISSAYILYLDITAHWVTSKFELYNNELLLSIKKLSYPHGATEIQEHLIDLFSKWKIHLKITAIVIDNNSNVKKIKADNTCWNLTLYAFQRLIILKPAISMLKTFLINNRSSRIHKKGEKLKELYPIANEWKVIKEMVKLLSPFESVTCLLNETEVAEIVEKQS